MNAKERAKAWEVDQFDPDNWFEIPEFGVLPKDVDFQGFAFPIVAPGKAGDGLRRIIREHVKTARCLVRKELLTLKEVRANFLQVLDMMGDDLDDVREIDASHAQAMSTFYMVLMGSADRAQTYSFGGWERIVTGRTLDECYDAITQCAEAVRCLAVQSLQAKSAAVDIQEIRSLIGRSGALQKLANDPKQRDKLIVRECWENWQIEPNNYESKAAFARDMLDKFSTLKSQPVIERWCRQWEMENDTQQAE